MKSFGIAFILSEFKILYLLLKFKDVIWFFLLLSEVVIVL